MAPDKDDLFAKLIQSQEELRQAIAELDAAIEECRKNRLELAEMLALIERVVKGDRTALDLLKDP